MMNKKGFMRILEATIAIMIILGALLVISSNREVRVSRDLTETLPPYLEEVVENNSLREKIMEDFQTSNPTFPGNEEILQEVELFLKNKIGNPGLGLSVSICELNVPCPLKSWPGDFEVFAAERIVSTIVGGNSDPRKLKVFLWKKG